MTDEPGRITVPDLTLNYDALMHAASNGEYSDSLGFHKNLINLLTLLSGIIKQKADNPDTVFQQVGLVQECINLIRIYDKAITSYRNTPLKALMIHDLKGAMGNTLMALSFATNLKHEDTEFIAQSLESLAAFINLIMIVIFPLDEVSDEYLIELLQNTFNGRINLEVNFNSNFLYTFKELIWPIHTILLNAKEKGAQNVSLSLRESEDQVIVEISDDIKEYNGVTGDALINDINTSINAPPRKIFGEELLTWEITDAIALPIAQLLAREGEPLELIFNIIVPLISKSSRLIVADLKNFLPGNFSQAILNRKVGDTDQLSGQKGLNISKIFLEMFRGTIVCVSYDGSRPLKSFNPNGYVKTIRVTIPSQIRNVAN
ncbi:MAG: hypothetical protein ACMG57_00925 [Candidatus Dojkabacteria bacterium]